jgi:hypothetical protein
MYVKVLHYLPQLSHLIFNMPFNVLRLRGTLLYLVIAFVHLTTQF